MTQIDSLLRARAALDTFGRQKPEELAAYERAKAALDQEARKNWHSEEWHRQQAAVLQERFDYGFQFQSLFPTYFDTAQVGEFDTYSITERRGLQVFWTAPGGYIDETQLETERYDFVRDSVGFHVSEFEGKLRASYSETIEALASLAESRLEAELNRRMIQTLQAAIPNAASPYYVNATSGVTSSIMNTALREVFDEIRPDNGSMPPITILGRAAMIDQVSDLVTDVSTNNPAATEEVRRRGLIGVYRGANVVRLHNYADADGVSYIPENELWVFAGTVGKMVRYGSARTDSWRENSVEYRHYQLRQDVGCAIMHPEYARRIVDPRT